MAIKPIDRITLNFYGDIEDDKLLIDYFNGKYNKKFRGQKIKEILVQYLKSNGELDLILRKKEFVKEINSEIKPSKKKTIKGLETYD